MSEEIINQKLNYTKDFNKYVENLINIPISYLNIFTEKLEDKYSMEISLYMSRFNLIFQAKKYEENGKWGLFKETMDLLYEEDPELFLELTIYRSDTKRFDLDKTEVSIFVNKDDEKIFPYFVKVLEMYFGEFVEATLIEVVNLTSQRCPISEKEFIKKYSYILENIKKESTIKKAIIN